MIHELKILPEYFKAVENGTKTFEIRTNDRDYKLGDILVLKEFDPDAKVYTGNECVRKVTYIIQGVYGLPENVCVMSIGLLSIIR